MRISIEQTLGYTVLLLLLALVFLFGFMMAEKGAHALRSQQAVPAMATSVAKAEDAPILGKAPLHKSVARVKGKSDLQILGKDLHGTKPTWSEQLSRHLEGQDSVVGDAIDSMSLHVGTWMQAGSKTVLETLSFIVGK